MARLCDSSYSTLPHLLFSSWVSPEQVGEGLINSGFGRYCRTNLAGGKRDATGGDKHESDAEISALTQALQRARNRHLYVIHCAQTQLLDPYSLFPIRPCWWENNSVAICPDWLKTRWFIDCTIYTSRLFIPFSSICTKIIGYHLFVIERFPEAVVVLCCLYRVTVALRSPKGVLHSPLEDSIVHHPPNKTTSYCHFTQHLFWILDIIYFIIITLYIKFWSVRGLKKSSLNHNYRFGNYLGLGFLFVFFFNRENAVYSQLSFTF